MRIPVPICHGLHGVITRDFFTECIRIAAQLGFESITYPQLLDWLAGHAKLPERPIMFTFDHAHRSMLTMQQIMATHGYSGTLFVDSERILLKATGKNPGFMEWEEIALLARNGWDIGAHTHSHQGACRMIEQDPTGASFEKDILTNNALLRDILGVKPLDYAYAGPSWSAKTAPIVRRHYRSARLWITRETYEVDGSWERYAEFLGSKAPDEDDGGPPHGLRYITPECDPYMLPSVEWTTYLDSPRKFFAYLKQALPSE